MGNYNKGSVAQAERIDRCDFCHEDLKHTRCTECGAAILKVKEFRCFGPDDSSWHICESCYKKRDALKCTCGSKNITYWGVDIDEIYKAIVYKCLDCNRTWTSKPIKKW